MKTRSHRFTAAALVAAAFLSFAGCQKQKADAKDAVADLKAAAVNTWDSVKDFSFDKRDDFKARAKAMSSDIDARISKALADYSDANASASRKAAMAQLKDDEASYKSKLDALGNATSATWDSAKQNVIAAWDKLQASYEKARAN